MLKKLVLAAGTLLATALIATPPALASTHRSFRHHHHVAARGVRVARGHHGGHLRSYAGERRRYGRLRASRRGFALAGKTYGHHHHRLVAIGHDHLIQRYAAPASSAAQGGAQIGGASYYGGRNRTASGGFVGGSTCAHRTLPFGTRVLVTNLSNARQAVLTVNDRGPFIRGRIVDVSVGAAGTLGMLHSGTARVSLRVVGGPS